jgi:hypothetical protein
VFWGTGSSRADLLAQIRVETTAARLALAAIALAALPADAAAAARRTGTARGRLLAQALLLFRLARSCRAFRDSV